MKYHRIVAMKPAGPWNPKRYRLALTVVTALILCLPLLTFNPAVNAQDISTKGGDPGLNRLGNEIVRLAESAGGVVGVGAVHIETGREIHMNKGIPFPMASTYKVPVAVQIFTLIDRGERSLGDMITVEQTDLHPGSGTLSRLFDDPGVILSLHNLIELMLLISDNSATDMVMREAGGSAAVTERMRALGCDGITVDRPTLLLIGDWIGVKGLQEEKPISNKEFRELSAMVTDEEREYAAEAFNRDTRDTSTPDDMAKLLAMIWNKEILSEESSTLLIDIMRRCDTGRGRIKGILPRETVVYHKTGTIGQTLNDVGIIELPDDAGHVATAIFVKESERNTERREQAVAQIARAIYDYFLFNPGSAR